MHESNVRVTTVQLRLQINVVWSFLTGFRSLMLSRVTWRHAFQSLMLSRVTWRHACQNLMLSRVTWRHACQGLMLSRVTWRHACQSLMLSLVTWRHACQSLILSRVTWRHAWQSFKTRRNINVWYNKTISLFRQSTTTVYDTIRYDTILVS